MITVYMLLYITINESVFLLFLYIKINYHFLIIVFCIFIFIKFINNFKKKKEEAPAAPPAPSAEEVLLTEIRDLLKNK